jgi:hypothetical protein
MANGDWRSAAAYEYLSDLSAPNLAFEFLRRNPDYRADFQMANEQDALGEETGAHARLARRWGLRFPG